MIKIDIAGNDYLGLARDPRLADAAARAARDRGISATAGRWSIGWTDLHQQLEARLAVFFGTEDACIHGSGYLGAPAFFAAMEKDYAAVFCDEFVHSCVYLGMRGAGLDIHPYRHMGASDLAEKLDAYDGPPPIVTTDGVYGISGEIAPLDEVVRLGKAKGALVFSDDSHGLFCVGPAGKGTAGLFGLGQDDLVVTGSMSKALGCYGGCTAGPKAVIERVRRAVNYVGSTPLPLPIVGACIAALEVIEEDRGLLERLRANRVRMVEALSRKRVNVVSDERCPIVTMALSGEEQARRLAEHLCENGLVLRYFQYPTEPRPNLLRAVSRACYDDGLMRRFETALGSFDWNA
jgi:7-keto-8-aminopelargonate synthetase-like enzyme